MRVRALETTYIDYVLRRKDTEFDYHGPKAACLQPIPPDAWPEDAAKTPARAAPQPSPARSPAPAVDLSALLG